MLSFDYYSEHIPPWIRLFTQNPYILNHVSSVTGVSNSKLGKLLGCADFGCVFKWNNSPWVVKITSDPDEGNAWLLLKKLQDAGLAPGVVKIKDCVRLTPDLVLRKKNIPLHLIIREEIFPIFTKHAMGNGSGFFTDYTRKILGIAVSWKEDDAGLAKENTHHFYQAEWGLEDYLEASRDYHHVSSFKNQKRKSNAQKHALDRLHKSITQIATSKYGRSLAFTLHTLRKNNIFLRDLHLHNVGWSTMRMQPQIVILDPGHTPDIPETAAQELARRNPSQIIHTNVLNIEQLAQIPNLKGIRIRTDKGNSYTADLFEFLITPAFKEDTLKDQGYKVVAGEKMKWRVTSFAAFFDDEEPKFRPYWHENAETLYYALDAANCRIGNIDAKIQYVEILTA